MLSIKLIANQANIYGDSAVVYTVRCVVIFSELIFFCRIFLPYSWSMDLSACCLFDCLRIYILYYTSIIIASTAHGIVRILCTHTKHTNTREFKNKYIHVAVVATGKAEKVKTTKEIHTAMNAKCIEPLSYMSRTIHFCKCIYLHNSHRRQKQQKAFSLLLVKFCKKIYNWIMLWLAYSAICYFPWAFRMSRLRI